MPSCFPLRLIIRRLSHPLFGTAECPGPQEGGNVEEVRRKMTSSTLGPVHTQHHQAGDHCFLCVILFPQQVYKLWWCPGLSLQYQSYDRLIFI